MPMSPCAVKVFSVALLSLFMTVAASAQSIAETKQKADEDGPSEQLAIQQLRGIAESIKKCPGWRTPDGDYGSYFGSAPLNVIWDIEQRQSTRSDKLGYIEFVQHAGYDSALPLTCRKKDVDCQTHNKVLALVGPTWRDFHPFDQFRYEFDLGPDGLEFVRALMRHENADEHWVATELKRGCVEDGVRSVLNHSSAPLVDSSSVAALVSPNARPQGVPQAIWEAANKGDANAMLRLGVLYESGKNVPLNREEAVHWFLRAADKGIAEAEFFLGVVYLNGEGVQQDYPQGMFWLRKSAEQSDANAEYSLGHVYYYGEGTAKDAAEAYFWFSLAAMESLPNNPVEIVPPDKLLNRPAQQLRDEIAAKLKPAKLREAQQRISQWVESHPKAH